MSQMTNEQRERMLAVVGKAFDTAAVTCSHQRQAALRIIAALSDAGFQVTTKRIAR